MQQLSSLPDNVLSSVVGVIIGAFQGWCTGLYQLNIFRHFLTMQRNDLGSCVSMKCKAAFIAQDKILPIILFDCSWYDIVGVEVDCPYLV